MLTRRFAFAVPLQLECYSYRGDWFSAFCSSHVPWLDRHYLIPCVLLCRYQNTHIAGVTIRRGSLLVALDIISAGSLPMLASRDGKPVRVPPAQWLQWLQLPWPKDGGEVIVQVRWKPFAYRIY